MDDLRNQPYTVEQLQQEYALSLSRAVVVFDRFGGNRSLIDKMMKRCPQRESKTH